LSTLYDVLKALDLMVKELGFENLIKVLGLILLMLGIMLEKIAIDELNYWAFGNPAPASALIFGMMGVIALALGIVAILG